MKTFKIFISIYVFLSAALVVINNHFKPAQTEAQNTPTTASANMIKPASVSTVSETEATPANKSTPVVSTAKIKTTQPKATKPQPVPTTTNKPADVNTVPEIIVPLPPAVTKTPTDNSPNTPNTDNNIVPTPPEDINPQTPQLPNEQNPPTIDPQPKTKDDIPLDLNLEGKVKIDKKIDFGKR